jgi:hypothetical protein
VRSAPVVLIVYSVFVPHHVVIPIKAVHWAPLVISVGQTHVNKRVYLIMNVQHVGAIVFPVPITQVNAKHHNVQLQMTVHPIPNASISYVPILLPILRVKLTNNVHSQTRDSESFVIQILIAVPLSNATHPPIPAPQAKPVSIQSAIVIVY